ncbi:hypothetical protein [Paenibacillus rigui]|uniref:Uncharacterized protein n=1 Tax=Paenibacillus rigui TaxID=554312 RepID=A0A229UKX6_9BACL|nr:hypothetical protein [Paenibacillus rigui]OXM83955.1 hypothetical protein CF651_22850 [Paenibacillus rigui]
MKPLLPHWKLNCDECGSDGDDVQKYYHLQLKGGGHITLSKVTMFCDECKQGIIDRAEADLDQIRKKMKNRRKVE